MSRQRARGSLATFVTTLLALAGALLVTSAANAATTVTRASFSTYQFNQCAAGEVIEITGTSTVVSRSVDEHTTFETMFAGAKAYAPATGAQYVAMTGTSAASYAEPDGSPSVLTVVQHVRFVRLGEDGSFSPGDDFALKYVMHVTTTPDGTTTTQVQDFEVICF